jgi:hypothetical protein
VPAIEVHSPLHPGQEQVMREAKRFNVLACGRRWGKSHLALELLIIPALEGYPTACFQATTKLMSEFWRDLTVILAPLTARKLEQEHRLELTTGGSVDLWSLESEGAGRGRRYKTLVVDEAGLVRGLDKIWNEDLRPTLADYAGSAWFVGTPNGRNGFWQFFQRGQAEDHPEWMSWTFPSSSNPFLPPGEIEGARAGMPERSYAQEFLAMFVSDGGAVFRRITDAIDRGRTETSIITDRRLAFGCGIDIGRHNDATVITILDSNGVQHYWERFVECSYPRQFEAIKHAMTVLTELANADVDLPRNSYPLKLQEPSLVLDVTGVGDPIYDALLNDSIPVFPYTFTNLSKRRLIDSLAAAFDNSRIRLMDIEVQEQELLAFEVQRTATGLERLGAPPGMHDDAVIALALAYHGASQVGWDWGTAV